MRMLKKSLLFAAICLMPTLAVALPAQELAGYASRTVSADFEKYLEENKEVARQLARQPALSKVILSRPQLQQQLIAGKLTLAQIHAQFLAAPAQKQKAAKEQPELTSQAREVLARAVGAGSSAEAKQRSAKEIEDNLNRLNQKQPEDAEITPIYPIGGGGHGVPVIPPPVQNQAANLNAVPTNTAPDSTGWPQYLNAPQGCAAPTAGLEYVHHGYGGRPSGGFGPFIPGTSITEIIRPFLSIGTWFHTPNIHKDMVLSIPFHAENHTNAQGKLWLFEAGGFQFTVAHCPGDFTNITPAGKNPLSEDCQRLGVHGGQRSLDIISAAHDDIRNYPNYCRVEPGKQYFINIRPLDQDPPSLAQLPEPRWSCGDNCTLQISVSPGIIQQMGLWRPYAGPCLSGPPYPENYNNQTCGESRATSVDCREPGFEGMNRSCYDPENKVPPQRFVQSCSPDGQRLTWTEGYNKPFYSSYVCDSGPASSITHIQGPFGEGGQACSAANEGQTATIRSRLFTSFGNHIYGQTGVQCQFHAERQRFDWVGVDAYREDASAAGTPTVDTCALFGSHYPLETVIATDQGNFVCRNTGQRLNNNVSPFARFIPEGGYSASSAIYSGRVPITSVNIPTP